MEGLATKAPKYTVDVYHRDESKLSQNKRRQEILKLQKERSRRIIDIGRGLLYQEVEIPIENDTTEQNKASTLETLPSNDNVVEDKMDIKQDRVRKPRKTFDEEKLMIFERLMDIPEDFFENWLLALLPEGIRCIVTAYKMQTVARFENGEVMEVFPSYLPNGSRHSPGGRGSSSFCILDCIFDKQNNTFYILDVISWKGQFYSDCPTTFRYYWVNDKLSEIPKIQSITSSNYFIFKPIVNYKVKRETVLNIITQSFSNANNNSAVTPYVVSKLLFVHSEMYYDVGENPLACIVDQAEIPKLYSCIEAGNNNNSENITMSDSIQSSSQLNECMDQS